VLSYVYIIYTIKHNNNNKNNNNKNNNNKNNNNNNKNDIEFFV